MEDATDVWVELVELVDRVARVDVPEHAVAQHKVIGRVEGRLVLAVVVGPMRVIQRHDLSARRHVVDLNTGFV